MDLAFIPPINSVFDSVFWTLGVEMRWYLVCPLLLMIYSRSRILFFAIGIGAYVAYFGFRVHLSDIAILPCFMLGVFAADISSAPRKRILYGAVPIVGIALFAYGMIEQSGTGSYDHADVLWHFVAFLLVASVGVRVVKRFFSPSPLRLIGRASYSIYLIHLPVLAFLMRHHWPTLLAATLSVMAGLGFYYCVEREFLKKPLRRRIEAGLSAVLPLKPRLERQVKKLSEST